jgi:membrane protease YdiL (CAAX protease family)
MNVAKRSPLVTLFLAAYALSFWIIPLHVQGFPVFPYGPDAALILVSAAVAGRRGVRQIFSTLRSWRARPRWYALAILVPVGIALSAVFLTVVLGGDTSALPGLRSLLEFIVILPLMIVIGGALGEEPAWRGFALPVLQQRHRPVVAVALLTLGHAVWHLPLLVAPDAPAPIPWLLELAGGAIVLAWLMNVTGQIWVPVVLHGAHNMSQQAFMSEFDGSDLVTVQWLTAVGWVCMASVIVWKTRGRLAPAGRAPLTVPISEPLGEGLARHAVPTLSHHS